MYNISTLDKEHYEAYQRITDLLQAFMGRQNYLRKSREAETEKARNKGLIRLLQFIRYHLQGCDDVSIEQKCPNWRWDAFIGRLVYVEISVSNWVINKFEIQEDPDKYYIKVGIQGDMNKYSIVSGEYLLDRIFEIIQPKPSYSLFDLIDPAAGSVTLQHEIDRMKQKLHLND